VDAARRLPAEARLHLLAALGPEGDAAFCALAEREAVDWDRVLALALRDRSHATLWARVCACGGARIPARARERMRQLAAVAAFRQGRLEELLGGALDALREEGLSVLLLKGAALAAGVYGSFAARPMADLDLMVPPEHAERAQRRLLAGGWTPAPSPGDGRLDALYAGHHHLRPLVDAHGSGVVLEVHVQPLPPGHPFVFAAEEMWRDAQPVRVAGRRAQAPSVTHQLLHLALHFAWAHALRSGAWRTLRDVRTLAARGAPDWPAFVVAARDARAAACAGWTLRLARGLMDAPVPDEVLRGLRLRGPQWLLRRLDGHLAATLFGGADCPSPWLERRLWEMAIRPGAGGHGAARPWTRDRAFVQAGVVPAGATGSLPAPSWRDPAGWRRWLSALRV
jgi:hypothetical protein